MSQTYAVACVRITDIMQATFEPLPEHQNVSQEKAQVRARDLWTTCKEDDCIYIAISDSGKAIPEHVHHLEQLRIKKIRQLQAEIAQLSKVDYAAHKHEKVTG